MISQDEIHKQLDKINFSPHGWNRSEVRELQNIILPDEEIYECVNGFYEGGYALLVATDVRVLLIDKKPLSFLNVEDLRFDMINEIDYNHRAFGSAIKITTGSKALMFRSYNKERLRKLIGHVQHCMAASKKQLTTHQSGQNQHLEQINQQLQTYLVAQYNQQQKLQEYFSKLQAGEAAPPLKIEKPEMSSSLKDYLYAKGIVDKYVQEKAEETTSSDYEVPPLQQTHDPRPDPELEDIYAAGVNEVFGRAQRLSGKLAAVQSAGKTKLASFEVSPLRAIKRILPEAIHYRHLGFRLQPRTLVQMGA